MNNNRLSNNDQLSNEPIADQVENIDTFDSCIELPDDCLAEIYGGIADSSPLDALSGVTGVLGVIGNL